MQYEITGKYFHSEVIETDKKDKELFKHYSQIVESDKFRNKAILCHASCRPIIVCKSCNKSLSESDKFCSECGTGIKDNSEIEQLRISKSLLGEQLTDRTKEVWLYKRIIDDVVKVYEELKHGEIVEDSDFGLEVKSIFEVNGFIKREK